MTQLPAKPWNQVFNDRAPPDACDLLGEEEGGLMILTVLRTIRFSSSSSTSSSSSS